MTYELIASQTLGSDAASVTFDGIPQTYDDLVVIVSARSDRSGQISDDLYMTFNSSASGYSTRGLRGNGASATSDTYAGITTSVGRLEINASTSTNSTFSSIEIYIPNYAGPTAKSISASSLWETNATGAQMYAIAASWSGTAAINSIGFDPLGNFVSGSSFQIFGISNS